MPDILPLLPLSEGLSSAGAAFFLYAETHFRFFKGFPSLIYKKESEIVFDLPKRLAPDRDLPIMLILNEVDKYPADLKTIQITVSANGFPVKKLEYSEPKLFQIDHPFQAHSQVFVLLIPRKELPQGRVFVNCRADLETHGKKWFVLNDNLTGTAKLPFTCEVTECRLPGQDRCSYGDLHVHSQFSQSHVEFGPPVSVIDEMAHAFGADFAGISDHSYDLQCDMDDYLKWDEKGSRWHLFIDQIKRNSFKCMVILGEEVSCINSKGLVVHLCGFGLSTLIPGSLDGARKGRFKKEQLTIHQVLKSIADQGGLAIAAHPGASAGLLQRFFLSRGIWSDTDISDQLEGFQALNGDFSKQWKNGKSLWIKELQKGLKLTLVAGNDCHGDFNRYRYLSKPFITVNESSDHFFCASRTGVYGRWASQKDLLDAIRLGKTFVTNGPFLDIRDEHGSAVSKQAINSNQSLTISAESTKEFGKLRQLRAFCWHKGDKKENVCLIKGFSRETFSHSEPIANLKVNPGGYVRAEVECIQNDGAITQACTSPCYF